MTQTPLSAGELDPIILDASTAPKIFAPHEYVAIKAEMLAGNWATIQNALGKIKQARGGDQQQKSETEITLTLGDSMLAMMREMIVGWQVDRKRRGLDGNVVKIPLPYSKANVPFLPHQISNYVYNKMNELYQSEEVSAEAQENFSSGASGPSEENLSPEN